jgi:hypothetical protein
VTVLGTAGRTASFENRDDGLCYSPEKKDFLASMVKKLTSEGLQELKLAVESQMCGLHDAKGPRNSADVAECSFSQAHRQRAAGFASN